MAGQGKGKLIEKCDALYVWHKDAIFRMASGAVGGDNAWALKLLEECMVEASANIEKFGAEGSNESKSKITALLQGRINKIYLEVWRKTGLNVEYKGLGATQKDKYDVDQVLIRNGFSAELAKYVGRLSNADKELIFVRYFMGFTNEELSKRYEVNTAEIEKRIFLVKQKIAKMIMER